MGAPRPPLLLALGCRTAECLSEREFGSGAKARWIDVGAPRPHTPRQGAQALHQSWEMVCRAYTAILNVPKLRKNLSPFMAADFSLFCHGSARGGPHVPRTPLRWAAASPLRTHRTTPSGVHKPRKRRTSHTTLVAVRRHTASEFIGGDIAQPGGFCKREARGVDLRPRPSR